MNPAVVVRARTGSVSVTFAKVNLDSSSVGAGTWRPKYYGSTATPPLHMMGLQSEVQVFQHADADNTVKTIETYLLDNRVFGPECPPDLFEGRVDWAAALSVEMYYAWNGTIMISTGLLSVSEADRLQSMQTVGDDDGPMLVDLSFLNFPLTIAQD